MVDDLRVRLLGELNDIAKWRETEVAILRDAIRWIEGATPDDPPPPPPPPDTTRSIFGWNLGGAVYWDGCRPFTNHANMAIVNVNRGAKLDNEGYLIDGYGQAWVDQSMLAPGRYDAYGSELEINETSSGTIGLKIEPLRDGIMLRRGDEVTGITPSPSFVDRYRTASCIRCMDALATVITDDRHREGCYYRAWDVTRAGNPETRLQRMITPYMAVRLSKAAGGCDIWWNFHHLDSVDWIRQQCLDFLTAFDAYGVSPKIKFEDTNERWNPSFPGWRSAVSRGIAGQRDFARHAAHHAERTRQIGRIAREVLGENAVVVVSAQNANVNWAAKVLESDPQCDMIAVSAYWGNLSQNEYRGDWSVNDLIAHAEIYQQTTTRERVMKHVELATHHGVRIGGYEGGVHFQQDARQKPYEANIREALADPLMGSQYRKFGQWWAENVNDVLCWYNDVSVKTFGAKRLEHEPDTTPRMAAVMELMR